MRRMTRSANLTTPFRLGLLVAALLAVACAEKLKNGLEINVTKAVDCDEKTKGGDMVEMHYTGTLANGDVFDSSRERDEPLEFRLGSHMVIAGWDQGLLDMCIGEERTLVIPPAVRLPWFDAVDCMLLLTRYYSWHTVLAAWARYLQTRH